MDSMLSISQKNELLKSFTEIEMHKELKILFEKMYPKKEVYVTHGQNEFGKDLMILENDILETIVTSIVVKMDKLSGSTTDKAVQEIRTQVSQSLQHLTYIKEIGKSYKAIKVILIIFGEISNNAEANLKIELGDSFKNTKILNLNDIRQLFENYYPGIFLGASGTVVLIERITHIDKELLAKNRFLNETYIPPLLRHYPITKQDLMRSALVTSSDTKTIENLRDTICGHKLDIEGFIKHVSEKNGNFYIEGDAGSGKSVFILKLTQSLLKKEIQELDSASMKKTNEIHVPVFLKATELKNGKIKNLSTLIKSQYNDSNANLIINLLIVDGIDEVKDTDRHNIITACEEYATQNNIKLIITGRKNPSTKKTLSKYHYYEILALEKAQAIEFLKKSLQRNQILLSSLLRGLDQLENQIPFYPMALSLLVELVIQHEEVPSTVTELYGKYIDLALGATGHNANEIESLYAPFIKRDFLSLLAYEGFFLNGSTEIKRSDFNDILKNYVSSRAHIASPESFFSDLERIAVLVLDDNYVKFSHKSFLDYMLATYFSEKREVLEESHKFDKIYELYHRPLWDDVVNFFFGLKKEITRHQIDEIVSAGKRICADTSSVCDINNFFLGRLLQYAWNTDSEVKEYAIEIGINESLNIKKQLFSMLTQDLGILGIPEIFGDVALLQMMELSYASKFVTIETDTVLQKKINLVKEGDATTLDHNKSFIYFAALFLISNHKYLSQTTKDIYLTNLLALEEKMIPEMSLTLFQLLTIFQYKKKFFTNEQLLEEINITVKKLRKKFIPIAQKLFVFKNKIDQNSIDKLRSNFLKKRK